MKIRIVRYLEIAVVAIVFFGCSGLRQTTNEQLVVEYEESVKPDWTRNRPSDPHYYTGIAVASKTANPTTYALVAQRNALNEMASQIEVRVKSNSMLFSFEDNNVYGDEFKEFVQVKANQQINNYEQVATWENATEYWVYYRLSKAQYKKDKQDRINKATNLSIGLLRQAELQEREKHYKQALIKYFDALNPIKPYLGEPLQVQYLDSQIYLGNYLFDKLSWVASKFQINPKNTHVKAVWGGSLSMRELAFYVTDHNGVPIEDVPVRFEYSEGIIRPRDGTTNGRGEVFTGISKISSMESIQEVRAYINFKQLVLENEQFDDAIMLVLKEIPRPEAAINISVMAPSVFIVSTEKRFGTGQWDELKNAFASESSGKGFEIVQNKQIADLQVTIRVDTRKSGMMYGLFHVSLNGTIEVKELLTGKQVYYDQFISIKGVSSSYEHASVEAYQKAIRYIREKVVPRFYRKYLS